MAPNRAPNSSPSLFPGGAGPTEAAEDRAPRTARTGTITAHCDGGARGNPGPAGYGAEITDAEGMVVAELSEFLGICTNNVAEYSGLLASLQYALDHGHRSLRVVSDSELMVKQIQGKYKVNSPDLKPLWAEAKKRIGKLERFEISHALRHKNKAADRLANEAMDRGMRRGTPAEGKPTVRGGGVQSLPLRAVPYPQAAERPAAPARMDPAAATGERQPVVRAAATPAKEVPPARQETPEMLRGFSRDGVIHILGGHTLPDGRFVKIVPE